jgi:hypothetical protein
MFTKSTGDSPIAFFHRVVAAVRDACAPPPNELSYADLGALHRLEERVERANEQLEAIREEMKTVFIVRKIVDDFITSGSLPSELKVPNTAREELAAVRKTYLAEGHCDGCMRDLHASLLRFYLKRPEDIFTFFSKVERVEVNPYGVDIDDAVSRWIAGDPVPQILALIPEDIEKLGALSRLIHYVAEERDAATHRLQGLAFGVDSKTRSAVRTDLETLKAELEKEPQ